MVNKPLLQHLQRNVMVWLRCCSCSVIFHAFPAPGHSRRVLKEDRVLTGLNQAVAKTAAALTPRARAQAAYTSEELLERIMKSLDDDKAEDVVQIDLRGKSSIGDYMVVASGRSTRQVSAMAEKLAEKLKDDFGLLSKIEGKETGDWVLIDTADVIVHIFRPEVREFYQLEKMWQPEAAAASS